MRLSRFNASYSLWRTCHKDPRRTNSTIQCRTDGAEGQEENQACMFRLFHTLKIRWGVRVNLLLPTQHRWTSERHKPLESRLILSGICHLCGRELVSTGILLWISLSRSSLNVTWLVTICLSWAWITLLTASNVYEEVNWVVESVLLLGSSASCFWSLNITPFDERLPGSNASCSNRWLVRVSVCELICSLGC